MTVSRVCNPIYPNMMHLSTGYFCVPDTFFCVVYVGVRRRSWSCALQRAAKARWGREAGIFSVRGHPRAPPPAAENGERTPGIPVYKGLLSPGTERTGSAPSTEQMSSLAASSAARNPVQNGSNTMNYRRVDGRVIHIIQTHSLDRKLFLVFFLKIIKVKKRDKDEGGHARAPPRPEGRAQPVPAQPRWRSRDVEHRKEWPSAQRCGKLRCPWRLRWAEARATLSKSSPRAGGVSPPAPQICRRVWNSRGRFSSGLTVAHHRLRRKARARRPQ